MYKNDVLKNCNKCKTIGHTRNDCKDNGNKYAIINDIV